MSGSKSYKIVVIGSGGVGKSCFTIQLISGTFVETYDPTLEDSYRKQMTVEEEEAVLNIYDTAGQEDFSYAVAFVTIALTDLTPCSAVRDQYIRIGEGFICMYSITNEASFSEVTALREKLVEITEEDDHPVVLVGNKCDLEEDRQVQKATAQALAEKYKWKWIEASAKTKTNVTETFQEIVRSIRRYRNSGDKSDTGATDSTADAKPRPAKQRTSGCALL